MANQVSVLDVAAYILGEQGTMSTWKLQKLCYYAQAWSLVWDEELLFSERIEAWANGPVAPVLYKKHRGRFYVSVIPGGDAEKLNRDQRETVEAVLMAYGEEPGSSLRTRTHQELPWREARRRARLSPGERGNAEILPDSMAEYYGGLYDDDGEEE